jgi:rubrerythrin
MSKSVEDLQAAFAGESQANRKYLAFAHKADQEGYHQAARLFRAAAEAETVHAHAHLRAWGGIGTTADNLKEAAAGENYESTSMYPEFIKDAEADNDQKALRSFNYALEAEKVHEQLYKSALETLEQKGEEFDYYVCPVCGHTHPRNAPDKCPICNTPGSKFIRIS